MRDRGNDGPDLINAAEPGRSPPRPRKFVGTYGRNDEHVGAFFARLQLKVLAGPFAQHDRSEGPERLPKLYLEVHLALHFPVPRVAQYAPVAKGPWPELHSSLHPADHL